MWQKFFEQTIKFTTVKECGSLLEPCFPATMVELLTLQGKCSPLRSKSAHLSGHLPTASWNATSYTRPFARTPPLEPVS
jgi:hypothetical protein